MTWPRSLLLGPRRIDARAVRPPRIRPGARRVDRTPRSRRPEPADLGPTRPRRFYQGEQQEEAEVTDRLGKAVENKRGILGTQRNLEFFTTAYTYLIQILPVLVVSPLYFAGTIELGVITQSTGAFNHVLNDLSIIVNQFEGISSFSAGLNRLSTFVERMESFRGANATATFRLGGEDDDHGADDDVARVENSEVADGALRLQGLSLSTPDGQRELFRDVSVAVDRGEHLLIMGDSLCGNQPLVWDVPTKL